MKAKDAVTVTRRTEITIETVHVTRIGRRISQSDDGVPATASGSSLDEGSIKATNSEEQNDE